MLALLGGNVIGMHVIRRSVYMLLLCLRCVWVSGIEQDGVERTINAVNGIVVRVIGRCVSGSFEVVVMTQPFLHN